MATKEGISSIFDKYKDYVKDPVVLMINATGIKLSQDINAGESAFFTTENVSPDRIKVIKEDPSKFVDKYREKHSDDSDDSDRIQNLLSNLMAMHRHAA